MCCLDTMLPQFSKQLKKKNSLLCKPKIRSTNRVWIHLQLFQENVSASALLTSQWTLSYQHAEDKSKDFEFRWLIAALDQIGTTTVNIVIAHWVTTKKPSLAIKSIDISKMQSIIILLYSQGRTTSNQSLNLWKIADNGIRLWCFWDESDLND